MKNWFLNLTALLVLTFGATLSLASCGKDNDFARKNILDVNQEHGYTNINLENNQYNLDNLPSEPLSDEERASILFMREEEKVARDAYIKLFEKWNQPVFDNISNSEATHMGAILQLINKYDLTDPVGTNGIGVFVNSNLQALYDAILPQGETSLVEGLKVGALIEEVDIIDLQNALSSFVDNQDIKMVYENLMKGSRNHLRAFVKNLKNQGITYVPQHLSQEVFDAIIEGDWEKGN